MKLWNRLSFIIVYVNEKKTIFDIIYRIYFNRIYPNNKAYVLLIGDFGTPLIINREPPKPRIKLSRTNII